MTDMTNEPGRAHDADPVENAPASLSRRQVIVSGATALAGLAAGIAGADAALGNETGLNSRGRLSGQTALVTGAARGIGRAYAVTLAKEGADVALVDICHDIPGFDMGYSLATPGDLQETARLVRAQGRKALSIQADVRDGAQMRDAAARTRRELGPIDILVANAAICPYKTLDQISDAEWDDTIAVNLTGVARSIQAVLPQMHERKQGRIIVQSSTEGRHGAPGIASYVASKWAIIGLTKAVALEVAKDNITVNAICPTGVRTAMTENLPTYRWADPVHPSHEALVKALHAYNALPIAQLEPDQVAAAAIFYAMPEAACITGAVMDVAAGANARWTA